MVVFLLDKDGGDPTGTGFLIVAPHESNRNVVHTYIVTAKHVVDSHPHTYMRFRAVDGAVHDVPLGQWEFHDSQDIAAQEIDFHLNDIRPVFNAYTFDEAIDNNPVPGDEYLLGQRIYFTGLLETLRKSMGKTMIPMVRSGTIGALNQPDIPLENGTSVTAHLIDGRSLNAFSGAPCYVQAVVLARDKDGGYFLHQHTRLLGIVVAHFDDLDKQSANRTLKLNTGVVVVIPVERVRELIEGDVMKEQRREWYEKYVKEHPDDLPATFDAMEPDSIEKTASDRTNRST
jgi:hypothetical protein